MQYIIDEMGSLQKQLEDITDPQINTPNDMAILTLILATRKLVIAVSAIAEYITILEKGRGQ